MNTTLWILQSFVAIIFLYSGICKSVYSERKLVSIGQTGVEGLPLGFIRFIGLSEILGAMGLILPCLITIYSVVIPISALCLALIMPFAARIHYKRKEYKSVFLNSTIFLLCLFIAYGRIFIETLSE
ncbi:MAG TPA: DoxX family protein [Chitinophagaceae bacterium]|nr:DoxX family protein [Chitinophagaceae bacterium]